MAQGKKYNDDIKEQALALLSVNNNLAEVSRKTGIPETTLRTWLSKSEKSEKNIVELRAKNKEKFVNKSWEIINKAQKLIDKRMNRAIEFENEIDALIDRIAIDDSLTDAEIKSIITKIKKLKLESATELSTVIGTLYDKQALANKEATAIVDGNIGIKKFEDL
jgi:hypothetical protein